MFLILMGNLSLFLLTDAIPLCSVVAILLIKVSDWRTERGIKKIYYVLIVRLANSFWEPRFFKNIGHTNLLWFWILVFKYILFICRKKCRIRFCFTWWSGKWRLYFLLDSPAQICFPDGTPTRFSASSLKSRQIVKCNWSVVVNCRRVQRFRSRFQFRLL